MGEHTYLSMTQDLLRRGDDEKWLTNYLKPHMLMFDETPLTMTIVKLPMKTFS